MEFLPLTVLVLDEYPSIRAVCGKVMPLDAFDRMMESGVRTARYAGVRILIGSQETGMVAIGPIQNSIAESCIFGMSSISNSVHIKESVLGALYTS